VKSSWAREAQNPWKALTQRRVRVIVFYFLLLLSFLSHAQAPPDSLLNANYDLSAKLETQRVDSIFAASRLSRWRDSISVSTWSTGLSKKIEYRFSNERITRFRDSLSRQGLPETSIANRTDSLLRQRESLLSEVSQKQNELQKRVSSRYEEWTKSLRRKFNLDSAGAQLPATGTPNLPQLPNAERSTLPRTSIPEVPKIPALETSDFSSLGLTKELTSVCGSLAIPSTDQLGEWKKSVPVMPKPEGMVNDQLGTLKSLTKDPGATAKKAVSEMADMNEATKELKEAEQLKTNNEVLKSAEQLKDPKASLADGKQQAINHFAGKEAVLQGAMSQMAKYKKKYHSLGSLSEIKKDNWLPRNGLKGKPFKERFRPGLNLGFRGGDTLLFDFYPNAAYRITGRIEAGLGAIYRVRIVQKPFGFDQREPVWGMNTFVVVKTFKAVFLRLEVDGNSFPVSGSFERPSYRDWRWSFYSGIQTNFKISKRLIGNAQMMYGFDKSLKDGFPERLQARVGVQYKLGKKK